MYVVGIPPGTRLISLTRGEYNDKKGWMAWLGIQNMQINPFKWRGTFLFCADDGSVIRVQNDGMYEDEFIIKGPDK